MKNNTIELVFILDKSGSMYGLEKDTIGGFNAMIKEQTSEHCRVTTVLFDTDYTLLHDREDIKNIRDIDENDYIVGGCTALYDAIGKTIITVAKTQKHSPANKRAKKVLFVIITDGEENSSIEFTQKTIQKLIEQQRKKYDWEFIFLAANIDAAETAQQLGIDADYSADFIADEQGVELNFKAMARGINQMCEVGKFDLNVLEEIRDDMAKRKNRLE